MGQQLSAWLEVWGLWGAAAVLLLEGMGLPFPVEVAFLAVGALMRNGHVTAWQAVAVCFSAALVGNLAGYLAAVMGGRPVLEWLTRLFRIRPERLRRLELWVQRNGLTALLITRLTHWGFAPALWLAGIMRLPWLSLLLIMVIGDLIWVSAWVLLGSCLLSTNPLHVVLALLALAAVALWLRRLFQPPAVAAGNDAGVEAVAALRFRATNRGGIAAMADDYQQYVREYFAEDAKTYDRRERLRRRMRQQLLRAAAPRPGERALDACTGTGEVALALAAAGAVVSGVDLSPDMLALARRKARGEPVEFLTGDTTALPFPDKSFDLCTVSMGLHCMPAGVRHGTLRELSRLARGRVVLMEPNTPRSWLGQSLLSLLGRMQGSPQYWSEYIRTGLDDMLADAGLAVERRIVFNAGIHMVLVCRPTDATR